MRAILIGYETILLEQILVEVINQRLAKLLHLKIMNHLTSMKSPGTAWYQSIHLSFMHKDLLMGVLKHFLCSRRGMKISLIVSNHPPPWNPGLKMFLSFKN